MHELSTRARRVTAMPMLRGVGAVAEVTVDVLVQSSKMEDLRELYQCLYFCIVKQLVK